MTSVDAYRAWTPAAQEKALAMLQEQIGSRPWRPFYCPAPGCDGKPHDNWTWNHARADQRPPTGDWLTWLMLSGRGSGKTRGGSEYTHRVVDKVPRIALVGATGADLRDVIVEGESGLLATAKPGHRPFYEPSKRRVTWPNGAVGTLFSAEEPDRLRGPEHYFAWLDEAAFYALIQQVWDNLMFGLRLGKRPRVLITTTPKPRPWLKERIADPRTRVARASTYDNLDNLSPVFAEQIISRYEGTRIGRQELHAELLTDVEGSLWTWDLIETGRVADAPPLARVVVAIDPAGSKGKAADETGIVVIGISHDSHLYILADRSGRYSPHGWATAANNAYEEFSADAIVAEKNYGGEMVRHTLHTSGYSGARVILVDSRRGKALRAEPVVGVYEQGKAHHVGTFPDLESQMTEWVPYSDPTSPDRVDALVHGATNLLKGRGKATVSVPSAEPLVYGSGWQPRVITGGKSA